MNKPRRAALGDGSAVVQMLFGGAEGDEGEDADRYEEGDPEQVGVSLGVGAIVGAGLPDGVENFGA